MCFLIYQSIIWLAELYRTLINATSEEKECSESVKRKAKNCINIAITLIALFLKHSFHSYMKWLRKSYLDVLGVVVETSVWGWIIMDHIASFKDWSFKYRIQKGLIQLFIGQTWHVVTYSKRFWLEKLQHRWW